MALASYARNVYGPTKLVDVNLVLIQALMVSGAPVIDTAVSSPETSISVQATAQFTIGFPKGTGVHLVGAHVVREGEAAGVGQSVHFETLTAAGVGTFETTTETADTPALPTDGSRIYLTLLVFNQ
jgi:hypothetical protein